MEDPQRLQRILDLAKRLVPSLQLVNKGDYWFMRAAGRALRPVNPEFMERYTVVLGPRVFLPGPAEDQPHLDAILAHELVHQLDQATWGPGFYLTYAVALPIGRTTRALWERRAYAVDLMLAHHRHGEAGLQGLADHLAKLFSGPGYLWMWAGTSSARAFLQPVVEDVRSGRLQQRFPYRDILDAWCGPD